MTLGKTQFCMFIVQISWEIEHQVNMISVLKKMVLKRLFSSETGEDSAMLIHSLFRSPWRQSFELVGFYSEDSLEKATPQ